MPKGSEALTQYRKEEIIDACASLYETMGFKDITIRDIGEKTSFTRTSIYNYFQTKEEIFLALLRREHERWREDLDAIARRDAPMPAEQFAALLSHALEKRGCMLKLMSMNLDDMECCSRLENLVDFKKAYAAAIRALVRCLEKFFPSMSADDIQGFLYAFLPFLFGVYPYTRHTDKQKAAMELAGIRCAGCSVFEIVRPFVLKMLRPFDR